MRWPFGPPHLTLKPSTKNKKQKKKKTNKEGLGTKKRKKNPKNKKRKKKKKQKKTKKKHKNTKKELFSYQSMFYLFWWVSKISFLTPWPKKRAPKKHYKNRGFSKVIFWKQMCVTKRPFLDKKSPNPEIPVIIFVAFSSPKSAETLIKKWT